MRIKTRYSRDVLIFVLQKGRLISIFKKLVMKKFLLQWRPNIHYLANFEVFVAACLNTFLFGDISPLHWVIGSRHFKETRCIHLKGLEVRC